MKLKITVIVFLLFSLVYNVNAQKNKANKKKEETAEASDKKSKKKVDPVLLKLDTLEKRLTDNERITEQLENLSNQLYEQNQQLLNQNDKIQKDLDQTKSQVANINDKFGQLLKVIENQNSELKKLNEILSASRITTTQLADSLAVTSVTKIEFFETSYDFGEIKEGQDVSHIYKFKNIGDKPLKILNATGNCGCTVAEWPKSLIEPGKIGEIRVVFNSLGKKGEQDKTMSITSNTDPAKTVITIKGKVIPMEKTEKTEKPADKSTDKTNEKTEKAKTDKPKQK